jgi:uncharacterized membrane protein YphA (DoxX/SURF4 family)
MRCTSKPLAHAVNSSSKMECGPIVAALHGLTTPRPAGLLVAGVTLTIRAAGELLAGAFSAVGQGERLRDWGVVILMAVYTVFSLSCGWDRAYGCVARNNVSYCVGRDRNADREAIYCD